MHSILAVVANPCVRRLTLVGHTAVRHGATTMLRLAVAMRCALPQSRNTFIRPLNSLHCLVASLHRCIDAGS